MIFTMRSERGLSYCGMGCEFRIGHLNVSRMRVLNGNLVDCDLIDTCPHRFVVNRVGWFGAEAVSRLLLERQLDCSMFSEKSSLTYFTLVCPNGVPSYYFVFVRQWSPELENYLWCVNHRNFWLLELEDCKDCNDGVI